MNKLAKTAAECIERIRDILSRARQKALQTVNTAMISAYWHIGREIVEEEQRGEERAKYGKQLLQSISKQLSEEFGKGFSERNLHFIRQFYLVFSDRSPEIPYAVRTESENSHSKGFSPYLS